MKFYLKFILTIVLLFVAALTFVFIYEVTSKDSNEYYDFSINDTSSVTKIIIWDKSPDTVFLSRQKNNLWLVNNSFKARPDGIETLLETIYRIRLRNFPQKSALPRILKTMATYGKHIDLYIDHKIAKSFTVGTETPDQLGTYMLMDGFETPVATHIPGFNGYLSSRFFIREDLWRTREIWSYEKEIASVDVSYPDSTSFKLIKENNTFSLIGPSGINLSADNMSSQAFFKGIRKAQYEGMIIPTDKAWDKSDSIQLTPPVGIFKVAYIDGKIIKMKIYRVPGGPDWLDGEGKPQRYDPDRYYAFISDGRFVLTQRFGLQHVLKSYRAFLTFE